MELEAGIFSPQSAIFRKKPTSAEKGRLWEIFPNYLVREYSFYFIVRYQLFCACQQRRNWVAE